MELSKLLAQPHLSLIARQADHELSRIQDLIEHKVLVDGRADIEEVLGRLLAVRAPVAPKTLDLIGHSSPGKSLLMLGDWVIDSSSATVTAFFRELAEHDVLPRLGIRAVRLLGCGTASSSHGRSTIHALARILEVEVYGTTELIYSAHYDARGFRDECRHALACSSDLRATSDEPREPAEDRTQVNPYPRLLDLDALPAAPLGVRREPWPRRIANVEIARRILGLVRRTEGAEMPGLLASPSCELALPSAEASSYHIVQVLLDGNFVRVYPDQQRSGIVYPVDDSRGLRQMIDELPVAHP